MTKFEMNGIYLQNLSRDKKEANKNFHASCNICCNRGLRIDCERCGVAIANSATIAAFELLDQPPKESVGCCGCHSE